MSKVQIEVENTFSTIYGTLPASATTAIDEATRYHPENFRHNALYKAGKWDGWARLYQAKTQRFPTGLLGRVKRALNTQGVTAVIIDRRRRPASTPLQEMVELTGVTLRDAQVEAVSAAFRRQRGILKASTGFGKSEVIAALVGQLQANSIILVPSKDLLHQTADRIEKRLGISVGRVGDGQADWQTVTVAMFQTLETGIRGGLGLADTNRLKKWRKDGAITEADFDKEMQVSAEKWAAVKELKGRLREFDAVFIDEAHHANTAQKWAKVLNCIDAYWRFALSATPFKEPAGSELVLIGTTGELAFDYPVDQAIEEGVSVEPICFMVSYDAEEIGRMDYHDMYRKAISLQPERNELVQEICASAAKAKLPTLVIVERIEHGEELAELTGWPFVHGDTAKWPTKKRKEIMANVDAGIVPGFISTVASEGLDLPNLACLVLASGGKAQHLVTQRVGRGIRLGKYPFCLVFDFMDDTHSVFSRQSRSRLKAYRDNGFKVGEVAYVPDIEALARELTAA